MKVWLANGKITLRLSCLHKFTWININTRRHTSEITNCFMVSVPVFSLSNFYQKLSCRRNYRMSLMFSADDSRRINTNWKALFVRHITQHSLNVYLRSRCSSRHDGGFTRLRCNQLLMSLGFGLHQIFCVYILPNHQPPLKSSTTPSSPQPHIPLNHPRYRLCQGS